MIRNGSHRPPTSPHFPDSPPIPTSSLTRSPIIPAPLPSHSQVTPAKRLRSTMRWSEPLSLGSLGVSSIAPSNEADKLSRKRKSCPNSHAFTVSSFGCSPSRPSSITFRTSTPTTASMWRFARGSHHRLHSAAPAASRRGLGGASRRRVACRLAPSGAGTQAFSNRTFAVV